MNWTGGRLSRRSHNGPGTLTHRQKQHFAKKRSKLMNGGISRAPADWPVFDMVEQESPQQDSALIEHIRASRSHSFGHPEDGYRNSRKPRKSVRHGSSQGFPPALDVAPMQRLPNWKVGTYDGRYIKEEVDDADGSEDGIAQMGAEAKRTSPTALDDVADMRNRVVSFDERRRNILRKNDWVGANIQHPIKLKFAVTNNDRRLGKRRKISAGHHSRFADMEQPTIACTSANRRRPLSMREVTQAPRIKVITDLPSDPSPYYDRISIGGRQLTDNNNLNETPRRPLWHRMSSQASASDIMLLDGEDGGRGGRLPHPSSEMQHRSLTPVFSLSHHRNNVEVDGLMASVTRTPHRQQINSSYGNATVIGNWSARNATDGLEANIPKDLKLLTDRYSDDGIRNEKHLNLTKLGLDRNFHTPMQHQRSWAGLDGSSASVIRAGQNGQHNDDSISIPGIGDPRSTPPATFITNISKQLSEDARKLQSVARDKSRRRAHPSSQTKILHPMPQSSATSRVLRSSLSNSGGSNVAEFGATQPLVPPSQEMDEEKWESWILPMEADGDKLNPDIRELTFSPVLNAAIKQDQPATKSTKKDAADDAWLKFILSDEAEEPSVMTPRRRRNVPSLSTEAKNSSILVTIGSDSSMDPLLRDLEPLPLYTPSYAARTSIPQKRKMTLSRPPGFTTGRRRGSRSPDPSSLSEGPHAHIGPGRYRKERDIYSLESD